MAPGDETGHIRNAPVIKKFPGIFVFANMLKKSLLTRAELGK
jgi:hypothetical protein